MPVSKSMQPSECSINAPEVEIVIHWLVAFLLLAVLAPTAVPGKKSESPSNIPKSKRYILFALIILYYPKLCYLNLSTKFLIYL